MNINFSHLFHRLVTIFIAFLPWSTFTTVALIYGLQQWFGFSIPGANFLKEIIFLAISAVLWVLLFKKYQQTKRFPLSQNWIIVAILLYILVMVAVTIFTTGIRGLVFGGRYDFMFLIIFIVAYYWYEFLEKPIFYYIKIFLISGGIMLFVSGLLKFPLNEELLLYFGYSPMASMWDFGSAPPIFHGIDGAGVRRFQGILDNPNTMGAFLILFTGMLVYFVKNFKDWYFAVGLVVFGLIIMILYTYSRSAAIGFVFFVLVAMVWGIFHLWKNFKKQILVIAGVILFLGWAIMLKYAGTGENIIGREGSTKGHYERMIVGINRVVENPFGQGLGSAGPAYRHVLQLHSVDRTEVEEKDRFYIPESWYIQQFIEWGILGGLLFLVIMAMIFFSLFSIHSIIAGLFAGIGAMNLFLHTFESSVISWLLFLFVGLFLAYGNAKKSKKSRKI